MASKDLEGRYISFAYFIYLPSLVCLISIAYLIFSSKVIGRAKRAPHWDVQSRFRVIYIYIYIYVVGMSRMSN